MQKFHGSSQQRQSVFMASTYHFQTEHFSAIASEGAVAVGWNTINQLLAFYFQKLSTELLLVSYFSLYIYKKNFELQVQNFDNNYYKLQLMNAIPCVYI